MTDHVAVTDNVATNLRLIWTKAVLWFLVGAATVVAVIRFALGLGLTTNLTDTTPWGMWIGFDVMAGVALAAGGFVIAGIVYILGRKQYHGIVRAAVLTAFLGYLAVIIGLMVDLGRPWNIWRPIFYHNLHSPLFEVAMCVMLYTTVLMLEFLPTGLEKFRWAQGIVRFLRRITLPLVILGIGLSSLHQSSLGTLLLLSQGRMPELWFSPILPLMFLVSAVALGLAMVTLESLITSWLYKREAEWPQLRGLTRAAAWVLVLYLGLRFGDLIVRGKFDLAFAGSWFTVLFWWEITMAAVLPILLFALPTFAGKRWAIGSGAFLVVAGFILNRADVGGISHVAITGQKYLPALSELAISLGIVAGLGLIFLFFIENLNVWEEPPVAADHFTPPAFDRASQQFVRGPWLGGGQRAVIAWIIGAVVGLGVMEDQVAVRREFRPQVVRGPKEVLILRHARTSAPGHDFELVASSDQAAVVDPGVENAVLIDSGGADGFVLFPHQEHARRLGDEASCGKCHHRNVLLSRGTSCTFCHTDMYRLTNTFAHERHVAAKGGKTSCVECHPDPALPKNVETAKACNDCHVLTSAEAVALARNSHLPRGVAPGYKQAMHTLCVGCHKAEEEAKAVKEPYLSECANCHRHQFADQKRLRELDMGSTGAVVAGK